jgi:hypothetical protein
MKSAYTFAYDSKVGISGVLTIRTDKGFEVARSEAENSLNSKFKGRPYWWITRFGAPLGEGAESANAKLKGCVGMPRKDPIVKGKMTRSFRHAAKPAGYSISNYAKIEQCAVKNKGKKKVEKNPILR